MHGLNFLKGLVSAWWDNLYVLLPRRPPFCMNIE